jgi:DNA-binding transcriptional ArsR family regulator
LPNADNEFTVQDIVMAAPDLLTKPLTASHVSQLLSSLADAGLVYKNRDGRYSLPLPLLAQFIRRQTIASLHSILNLARCDIDDELRPRGRVARARKALDCHFGP